MEWLALMIYCFFYALLLCIGVYAHHHWGIRIVCSFRLSKLVHGPLVGGNAMAIFCSQSVTAHSHCFLPLYLHGTTRNSKYFLSADSFSYITLWIADCVMKRYPPSSSEDRVVPLSQWVELSEIKRRAKVIYGPSLLRHKLAGPGFNYAQRWSWALL